MSYDCRTSVKKNRGGATTRYDSFEHVQNSRGLSGFMPISGDRLRFVQNRSDAVTHVLRMYQGLSRFLKSCAIGTKDRGSELQAVRLATEHPMPELIGATVSWHDEL